MSNKIFRKKDVMAHFNISKHGVQKMLDDGTLEPPYNRNKKGAAGKPEHPRWTLSQIKRCDTKLYELSLPSPESVKSKFRFTKKREARIIAYGMTLRANGGLS